jgi:hypothetical protein
MGEHSAETKSQRPDLLRNLIERFFNKQCRRVATRYDKLAANYLGFVKLASIRIWLRANESTSWFCANCGTVRAFLSVGPTPLIRLIHPAYPID